MSYPTCLWQELVKCGKQPTGNLEWDRAMLATLKSEERNREPWEALHKVALKFQDECDRQLRVIPDMSDEDVYNAHARFFLMVANHVLEPQRRKFIIDDDNRQVIRFLMLYFSGSRLCEDVFPGRGYRLHKNILLQGGVGVGKTLLMQVFSEYLKRIDSPRQFHNVSVTQMVNYYSVHNDIDGFLYNIKGGRGFQGSPLNLCLNDIGVDNRPFYGIDTDTIIHDFLHARNEIWSNPSEYDRKFAHLTTNLDNDRLKTKFGQKDAYGRIIDRFKTYNVIPLPGQSRR
ncbi:MAG: ATP-binding protein [Bacteroides sp.]|nr:ATP-binding protein [Bacteroides sp.]